MKVTRSTWFNAAIVLLACSSGIAVWATRDRVAQDASDGPSLELLPQVRREDVLYFELESRTQKLVLERAAADGGSASFTLLEPVRELADAGTVNKFLSAVVGGHWLRRVEGGAPLASFGLDRPLLRVLLRTGSHEYRIALGAAAPTPVGARYVSITVEDSTQSVAVISKSLADDLALDLDAFRLRSLISLSEPEITRIRLVSPKLALVLERRSGLGFSIAGAKPTLADRGTMQSLFFQLSRLTATRFLPLAEAETALGPERARLELDANAAGDTVRLEVGGSCPGNPSELVVVRRSPQLQSACATRELEATLRLLPSDFNERHAFSLHADEVEELDIAGGQKFSLVRTASGFVLHGNEDSSVELEAGNQRISALLEAEGELVPEARLRELGLEPAANTVTLRSSAARASSVVRQVVRVGNMDGAGNLLVYREEDGVVLRIPREQARSFAIDRTLLYSRKLTEFGLSSFVSAEITRPEGREVLRRGDNQELVLDSPKGFDPDGVLSSDLIQALGALTAERFVADRDDGTFGLAPASLSVHFRFKSEGGALAERTLRFGQETALGVFAAIAEQGPVFVLARNVRDACDTLLINRAVFPVNPETLNRITLRAGARTLRLDRQGERFLPEPGANFPSDRVAELLEALRNLRPEAGLHTGPALAREGFSKPSSTLALSLRSGTLATVSFGAGDAWRGMSVVYVRVSGIDATFVMAQSLVRALSDAL